MPNLPEPEDLIVSAAKFLIEGGQDTGAAALLSCSITALYTENGYWGNRGHWVHPTTIELRGPRFAYDLLSDQGRYFEREEEEGPSLPKPGTQVREAIEALLPHDCSLNRYEVRAEVVSADPALREDMLNLARGKVVHNQAISADPATVRLWMGLRFQNPTEVKIANALDQAGVMFLPNCRARLNGAAGRRENYEPDFLVCKDGHWGVLEVDGDAFHTSAAKDHRRDAFFLRHGIRCVRHFEGTTCYREPEQVVAEFLTILEKMYQ